MIVSSAVCGDQQKKTQKTHVCLFCSCVMINTIVWSYAAECCEDVVCGVNKKFKVTHPIIVCVGASTRKCKLRMVGGGGGWVGCWMLYSWVCVRVFWGRAEVCMCVKLMATATHTQTVVGWVGWWGELVAVGWLVGWVW